MIRKILSILKYKLSPFKSELYWDKRYSQNKTSGSGSYGKLAKYKAKIINEFILENNIDNVIEWGCGDGNQLKYMHYNNYIGYDISPAIISKCKKLFKNDRTRKFELNNNYKNETADLSLSLDVIFHLIEDDIFDDYMNRLFNSSRKYVIIYSSNTNKQPDKKVVHFKNRKFTDWIDLYKNNFKLIKFIKNEYPVALSVSDFYIYKKND